MSKIISEDAILARIIEVKSQIKRYNIEYRNLQGALTTVRGFGYIPELSIEEVSIDEPHAFRAREDKSPFSDKARDTPEENSVSLEDVPF
jgi:hypothetical protein